MVHDPVEQGHDKYNSFLSRCKWYPNINLIAVQLDLGTVIDWNTSYLQYN